MWHIVFAWRQRMYGPKLWTQENKCVWNVGFLRLLWVRKNRIWTVRHLLSVKHCVHADCREIKHKEKTSKELCHIQSDWDMRYFNVSLFFQEWIRELLFLSRLCQHQAEESVKSLLFQLLCLLGENSRGHFPGQFLFRKRQGYSRRWQ